MTAATATPTTTDPLMGDGAALREILALAGPDLAPRLLDQLVRDIDLAANALCAAVAAGDCGGIAAQSHVLISLVGTVGATGLHGDACTINDAAHHRDLPLVGRLLPGFATSLAELTVQLAAHRAAHRSAHRSAP